MLLLIQASAFTLVALVLWQLALWVFNCVTMPAMAKNAPKPYRPPYTLPFLHNTLSVLYHGGNVNDWSLANAQHAEGRPVSWKLLGRPEVLEIVSPELNEDVQKTQYDAFRKGRYMHETLGDLMGNGIFVADGANWAHQRKTASVMFTARMLKESMTETVHALVDEMQPILQRHIASGEPFNLTNLLNRFTMGAFSEVGYGVKLNKLDSEYHPFEAAFDNVQLYIIKRFVLPTWFWKLQKWLNIGDEGKLRSQLGVLNDFLYDVIAKSMMETRSAPKDQRTSRKTSVISLFLYDTPRNADGAQVPVDPVFLRDISLNLLGGARDTTAVAMSWFFYEVSRRPDIEGKIRQELIEKIPDLVNGTIIAPTMDQLQELTYLDAVTMETFRLYPSLPINIREASRDTVLCDGTFVRKGTMVHFCTWVMGRLETVWGPDAKEFKPERWLGSKTGKPIAASLYKLNTFYAGRRTCMGMQLATMQIKMLAASVLARYHFDLKPGQDVQHGFSVTLQMRNPLLMLVHPATAAPFA